VSDDFETAVLLWFGAVVVVSLMAAVAIVVGGVAGVGYGLYVAARAGYRALQGPPSVRQIRQIEQRRNTAIDEIIAIRQDATRRMVEAARGDVIDGHGYEIEE
jgi:hypothetical protein